MKRFDGYMHGINLGGWLSQCDHTKERYDTFINEEDVKCISEWGLDHIRVPIDYDLVEDKEGNYIDLLPHSSKIYAYKRELNGQEIIVVSNFTNKTVKNPLFNKLNGYKLVLSNYNNTNGTLEPFETRVYQNY